MKKLKKSVESTFDTVVTGPQAEKMSDVLEAFTEPYEEPGMSLEDRRTMLQMAVLAWNFALIDDLEQRKTLKEKFLKNGISHAQSSIEQEMKELIEELIARKEKHFAENKRHILNFELEDLGDEFYLSVASTLQP